MTADPDEDALGWAGDTDPSHVDTKVAAPKKDAAKSAAAKASADDAAKSTPSLLLITYGVLGGVYLIYIIGWVITVNRNLTTLPSLFTDIMFRLGEYLAIGSPAIWFGAVFLLTRKQKPIVRLLWLLLGLVAVIPWPFVLGV